MRVFMIRNREDLGRALAEISGIDFTKPWIITAKPVQKARSLAQNKLLYLWATEISRQHYEATGELFTPEAWKEYLQRIFLGEEAVEIRGKIMSITRKTSELTMAEFAEFLTNIDHFTGADLNVRLPHPDGMYWEAMGMS